MPLPEQVIKYIPAIASRASIIVFREGIFLSRIAMIMGVITIESCTINAVFDPVVLVNASIQKVLLATETRLTSTHIKIAFLLKLLRCLLNRATVTIKPMLEQMKRMKNGGKKLNNIFDHMYEEPQNRAFSNKKN